MKTALIFSLVLLLSACTSIDELKSTKIYTPKVQRNASVNVASRATGIKGNKVGYVTVLFPSSNTKVSSTISDSSSALVNKLRSAAAVPYLSLPIGTITAGGDTSANIMKSIRKSLAAAGYNNANDAAFNSADAGYLRAHVEKVQFGNFLFMTWGTIVLQLRLETREGEILWEKRVRSSVTAVNNFNRTAVVTMNRLVKDMTKKFVRKDFYTASLRIKRHKDFLEEDTAEIIGTETASLSPTPHNTNF